MLQPMRRMGFMMLAILTGVIAGLGALVFRSLIALVHNLTLLREFSLFYDANLNTQASPWGAGVILVPVVGSLVVTLLVTRFAPEAKGHGVPEVMDAVYYGRGIIRPVVALFKALSSAICIGTGGSVGREGPIAQIGSAFGSTVGQYFTMTPKQRITLIAAGAGGGIAATFNTPIGGLLFAVELLLFEVSVTTLVPVALATVTATYVGHLFFGVHPAFVIPALEQPYFHALSPWLLLLYGALGLLMGLLSTLYIHSLYFFEDFFERRLNWNRYLQHAVGMLGVGLLMYGALLGTGHYYVEGVGYGAVQNVLTGELTEIHLLVLLFVAKLLTTSLTLGSGGSGGIFSPALFLGATAGGAFGVMLKHLFPEVSPAAFAVAGMAGMVGGATGAAMTAIVMIFEMTRDYSVILPMTITVALSYGMRSLILRESIYTLKLVRRGHYMPAALEVNLLHIRRAGDVMQSPVASMQAMDSLETLGGLAAGHPSQRWFIVVEGGQVVGAIPRDYTSSALAAEHQGKHLVAEVMRRDFVFVSEDDKLADIVERLHQPHAAVAVVLSRQARGAEVEGAVGIITWEHIAKVLEESVNLISEFRDRK